MCRPPSSTSGRAVYKEGKTRISIIIAEIVIGRTRTPSPRYPDANGDHCLGPSAGQAEAFLGVIDHHAVLCGDGKHHAVGQVNGQCGLLGMDVHQLKNDGAKPDCHHRLQGRNSASVAPEQALSALGMDCVLSASQCAQIAGQRTSILLLQVAGSPGPLAAEAEGRSNSLVQTQTPRCSAGKWALACRARPARPALSLRHCH